MHVHILIAKANPIRFETLRGGLSEVLDTTGNRLEPLKGTYSQAIKYIRKNPFEAEDGTKCLYEKGISLLGDLETTEKTPVLARLHARLKAGESVNKILATDSSAMRHVNGLRAAKEAILAEQNKGTSARDRQKLFLYGPTGSGKTFAAHELAQKLNEPLAVVGSPESPGAWDGVSSRNNWGVLLLDDMTPASLRVIGLQRILTLLDVYEVDIQRRYSNVPARFSHIIMTSNFSPEELFFQAFPHTAEGSYSAFLRRFNESGGIHLLENRSSIDWQLPAVA